MDENQLIVRATARPKEASLLALSGESEPCDHPRAWNLPIFRRATRVQLHSMVYRQYLRSEHWLLLRGAKLQISPRCEHCNSKEQLEVHHLFYRSSWFDSQIHDLKTLCHDCHMLEHAKDWERIEQPKIKAEFFAAKESLPVRTKFRYRSKKEVKECKLARIKSARKRRMKQMRREG